MSALPAKAARLVRPQPVSDRPLTDGGAEAILSTNHLFSNLQVSYLSASHAFNFPCTVGDGISKERPVMTLECQATESSESEEPAEKCFGPRVALEFVKLISAVAIALVGTWILLSADLGDGPLSALIFWGVQLGLWSIPTLSVIMSLLRRPKLVLTPDGISTFGLWERRLCRWQDVGPFYAHEQHAMPLSMQLGLLFSPFITVYALTDRNHDLLQAHGSTEILHPEECDIKFGLPYFHVGRNMKAAMAFVEELNCWRNRYGAPEVEPPARSTPSDARELRKKLIRRKWRSFAFLMLFIILMAIIRVWLE